MLNPKVEFAVTKHEVEGLWEKTGLQIFEAVYLVDGQQGIGFVGVFHNGKITMIALKGREVRPLSSELLHNGEFYYTYGGGSGIYYSKVGRVRVVNGELEILQSGGILWRTLFLHADTDGKIHIRSLPFLNDEHPETAVELGVIAEDSSSGLRILDSKGAVLAPFYPFTR